MHGLSNTQRGLEMLTDPLLTVLMTVYNGGRYLRTAMDSILAQTYRDFRFLIVDDASNDQSRDIVRSYDDPRIELVALERNVGQTAALNIGLRRARSPWIARMDADDYAAPSRLQEQLSALERNPSLDCVGTFAWLFRDDPAVREGVIEKPLHDVVIKRQLWRAVPMIHGTLLVRRSALCDVGGYDERYRYSADLELYNRLLPRCRAANLPKHLIGLRRRPGQGSYARGTMEENIEIFSRILTTQCRTHGDRMTVRGSLAFTYCMRARLGQQEGKFEEMLSDWGRAFQWSPFTTVKQLAAPVIPSRIRFLIRQRLSGPDVPRSWWAG